MEELRWSLVVFGVCAITGILVHGMWTIRKNATKQEKQNYESKQEWVSEDDQLVDDAIEIDVNDPLLNLDPVDREVPSDPQYDELGIGEVRVVQREASENAEDTDENAEDVIEEEVSEPEEPPKVYASVVTQPKPEYVAEQKKAMEPATSTAAETTPDQIPEPPLSLMKKEEEAAAASKSSSDEPVKTAAEPTVKAEQEKGGIVEQASKIIRRKRPDTASRRRKEPRVGDDQMAIDFDEPVEPKITDTETVERSDTEAVADGGDIQQEVLVLNVKAPDDKPIQGSALLPMLLTLGFKFGDQDIFHRHVNSNGKGPVLFSLANMFKPGVFDIDNLENFTTQGISLFMILPIEGDPHQVFNMMHNAARKIADEFSGQVLDGRRSALTKQSLQQYVEKIREFERQRMIAR